MITTCVAVEQREVFGSLIDRKEYGDDRLEDVIEWLHAKLAEVPEEYRSETFFEIDSVGGWEGEHHVEMSIYYKRPETDEERKEREKREGARRMDEERRDRAALAQLKAKYEGNH